MCWEKEDSWHWLWDFLVKKTAEKGNEIRISAKQSLGLCDLCTLTLGFSQNLGWEMGIKNALQDPVHALFSERRCINLINVCACYLRFSRVIHLALKLGGQPQMETLLQDQFKYSLVLIMSFRARIYKSGNMCKVDHQSLSYIKPTFT